MLMKVLKHGGWITEVFVGSTIGTVTSDLVLPKVNRKSDKFMVAMGALVLSWYTSRKIHKEYDEWYKAVEELFGKDKDEDEN